MVWPEWCGPNGVARMVWPNRLVKIRNEIQMTTDVMRRFTSSLMGLLNENSRKSQKIHVAPQKDDEHEEQEVKQENKKQEETPVMYLTNEGTRTSYKPEQGDSHSFLGDVWNTQGVSMAIDRLSRTSDHGHQKQHNIKNNTRNNKNT